MDVSTGDRWGLDHAVFLPGTRIGHYESFYQRANHPTRPLAFWIRYTVFAPRERPDEAVGELWAVYFDGERGEHAVGKVEVPIEQCDFARDRFDVHVGNATLGPSGLRGAAGPIEWALEYAGDAAPVLLLPRGMYRGGFPKAKSLVPLPLARYSGTLDVGGHTVVVDDWIGSQNHNWGSRHTDRYAFAQVAGFDGAPESFLEAATAKATVAGPVRTPWTTFVVLRHDGVEYALNSFFTAVRAVASYDYFEWSFATQRQDVTIAGRVLAPREAFVCLRYGNPPGGTKDCLNTKIAAAEIALEDRRTRTRTVLRTEHRALFEILTDDHSHGIPASA